MPNDVFFLRALPQFRSVVLGLRQSILNHIPPTATTTQLDKADVAFIPSSQCLLAAQLWCAAECFTIFSSPTSQQQQHRRRGRTRKDKALKRSATPPFIPFLLACRHYNCKYLTATTFTEESSSSSLQAATSSPAVHWKRNRRNYTCAAELRVS